MTERFDVAVIGAGTATETLVGQLDGSGLSIVVFEADLVGGECPFRACMPSKSMLHDARIGTPWDEAVRRRDQVADGLDDSGHADDLVGLGAVLVRARAEIVDHHHVRADGVEVEVEHIVVATGSTPNIPQIDGADECAAAIWTSDDAYTSAELPSSVIVVGAGVIGMECATVYARFGTTVTLIDDADRSFPDAPPAVSDVLAAALDALGVEIRYGVDAASIRLATGADDTGGRGVVVTLSDGDRLAAERVLVATGRRPATVGFGLDRLGLDESAPLPVDDTGRLTTDGSIWAIGDVAGAGQYTHLANHQARVVADQLAGTATRRFDDVVVPSCVFTDPPMIQVGPSWRDLCDDADVVHVSFDLASFPRATTDELGAGHLWVAARRSTGCVVAAAGAGPSFDELTHAVVTAIDGQVPVHRLRQSMQAFPTIGEILGPVYDELADELSRED